MDFSVIVATYNQLPSLKLVLEALGEQTFQDFEVIVVDDGSSDGTKEYMEKNHPDIKYVWQEDKGFRLAKSKNNGIRISEGEYIIVIEADVVPDKELVATYKFWSKPDLVILGVRHDVDAFPDSLDYGYLSGHIVAGDWRTNALRQIKRVDRPWRLCSGCNVCFPATVLKEIGGWNENFTHYGIDDYEVCLRAVMAGCKIQPLPAAFGYHLKHDIRESTNENLKILTDLEKQYEASI